MALGSTLQPGTFLAEEERVQLARLLGLWDQLFDSRVGIIREMYEMPCEEDDPALFHFLSTACDVSSFTALRNFGNNGGASINRYIGLAKAVGEAVERYCSAIFSYNDLIYSSFRALDAPATDPVEFALYTPEQTANGKLPWVEFTEDSFVAWTPATSLSTGDTVLVPAAMAYVPYHYLAARRDQPIIQPISTGLAMGCSFEEAALSAVCEAIERDAFTITWQAQLSRPLVLQTSLPPIGRELVQRFTDVRVQVKIVDITTDIGVPTILTIALGDAPTSPAVAVAAATHPDPAIALIKSLEELAHTRKFAKQIMQYTPPIPVEVEIGHPKVRDQKDHLRFYCPQEAKAFVEFAHGASAAKSLREVGRVIEGGVAQQLAEVVQRINVAGMDVLVCDLTSPDIAELGLRVVRAIVPGMHPLFMGHTNRALGGRRLSTVPRLYGGQGIVPGVPDNLYPHPFP